MSQRTVLTVAEEAMEEQQRRRDEAHAQRLEQDESEPGRDYVE